MNNETDVVLLHVVSDALIALSYFSIPVALIYFVRRRPDLQFGWLFVMFAAFILACGTTHVFGVWAIWQPLYKVDGLVKLGTGLVSMATAVHLWKLMPAAVALPSPAQLARANDELGREVAERRKAQAAQEVLRGELEERVHSRTAELAARNETLHAEIAARQEAERQRNALLASTQAARDEAERANRSKDEFLAILSHELRTPLYAIQGWAQLLRRGSLGAQDVERGLEVIERNARVQTRLIEDLLDMSRIVSGKLRLDLQPLDPTQLVASAVASIRPAADAKAVRLLTELEPHAGPIRGDPSRLQQVVWNLLSNAVKFTPAGGLVQVTLARDEGEVELSVRDNGCGIGPEFMAHLFERFTQADSRTTRASGGLGLGLSIARHLVELHGGTISARSDGEGRGATFVVRLPVAPQAAPEPARAPGAPEAPPQRPDLSGIAALVVDDEPDAREMIARILQLCGASVATAASAEEAWRAFRERTPSVVVSDVAMPGEDGYSLVRRLRQLPAAEGGAVPAVALTALAGPEDRRRALQAGFQIHVAKPVDPEELAVVVASLTGRFSVPPAGE
jgi:signal transduction histidine kinase/CheY-like chemotaxis protein